MPKLIPVTARVMAARDAYSEPVDAILLQSAYMYNWALCKLPDGSRDLLRVVDVVTSVTTDDNVECEE